MGTIVQAQRAVDERYNKLRIYKGTGNVTAGGWGVRARDQNPGFISDSVICRTYKPASGASIKYVSFRVINAGVPATDYVKFSIWRKSPAALNFTRVYDYTIDEPVIEANYGAGVTFANDTTYIITLPEAVLLTPIADTEYFVCVYADGCELEYDDDKTVNGAYLAAGVDIALSGTYAEAALVACDHAVSFEAYSEPDRWVRQLKGGSIGLENTDWHNVLYATGTWPDIANIYGAGDAVSTTSGDEILIDLGAGIVPLTPWPGPPSAPTLAEEDFPNYTAYGVRAILELILEGEVVGGGDPGTLDIMISAEDTDVAPLFGYELVERLTTGVYAPIRISLPDIARWVRIVHSGGSDDITITDFQVWEIRYPVSNGDFPVDVMTANHSAWIENYPMVDTIRRVTAGNMAGGESLPSVPFTNREHRD